MKNSAAAPSGAWAKRRVRNLTKLMPIIFARYLASLTVYVGSSRSPPLTHSLPFIRLSSLPIYLAQLPLARFIMRSLLHDARDNVKRVVEASVISVQAEDGIRDA